MKDYRAKLLEILGELHALRMAADWIPNPEEREAFEQTADKAIVKCLEVIKNTPK